MRNPVWLAVLLVALSTPSFAEPDKVTLRIGDVFLELGHGSFSPGYVGARRVAASLPLTVRDSDRDRIVSAFDRAVVRGILAQAHPT